MAEHNGPDLDLALSGGGVRASFFSLGVVMYLLDSGLHRRVSVVSSVSGGSITNAALAMSKEDFATGSPTELRTDLQRFAGHLADNGPFFMKSFKYKLAMTGILLVLFFILSWIIGSLPGSGNSIYRWMTPLFSAEMLFLVAVVWWTRRRQQLTIFSFFLARIRRTSTSHGEPRGSRGQGPLDLSRLTDLPRSNTTHIFCATELVSGTPFLMTRDWTYSVAYGWTSLHSRLSEVIYASAAFPGVFPPLPVKVDPGEWNGGEIIERPNVLRLADGGIYNNLGTDWRPVLSEAARTLDGEDRRFTPPTPSKIQIVVNASAPARVASLGGIWFLRGIRAFARSMTIMYENTVRPRLEHAKKGDLSDGTIIIDIRDTPINAVDAIANNTGDSHVQSRARALRELLTTRSYNYWAEYNQKAARVKTTLDSVGKQQAAQLLRHGYLSAAVTLHSYLGTQGLPSLRDDRWFYNFLQGTAGVDELPDAAAPSGLGKAA